MVRYMCTTNYSTEGTYYTYVVHTCSTHTTQLYCIYLYKYQKKKKFFMGEM
jgi:hypothetical protein